MPAKLILLFLVSFCFSIPALGQGTQRDYERAAQLPARFSGKVRNTEVSVTWSSQGDALYVSNPSTTMLQRIDLNTGELSPALDQTALQKTLGERAQIWRIALGNSGELWALAWQRKNPVVLRVSGESIKQHELKESHPFHAQQFGGMRSQDNSDRMRLVFVNKLDTPVSIFWIDREGNATAYEEVAAGQSRLQSTYGGHVWSVRDQAGNEVERFIANQDDCIALIDGEVQRTPQPNRRNVDTRRGNTWPPRRSQNVYVADYNLNLRTTEGIVSLTTDGTQANAYGGPMQTSPDGSRLLAMRTEPAEQHIVSFVESSPNDQIQPKLHQINYPKPGDKIAHPRPVLFDMTNNQQIPVDNSLFPNPWSIDHVHWASDSSRVYFLYNQRGHQVMRLLAIDAKTGDVSIIIEDRAETFIDYSQKLFLRYLDATDEVLWSSERDGWNHLYLFDLSTGALKQQVTQGNWVLREVVSVDEAQRTALVKIMGYYPEQDPYYIHYARVNLDKDEMTLLTEDNGTHEITFSPDGAHYIDTWSRVDQPKVTQVRRSKDGTLVRELGRADASQLVATGWIAPQPFQAKGRDSETDIYGVIYRPTNLDESKTYPVIESIYAGPHGQHVPKNFAAHRDVQSLAELGFIVVQIDGMGTNWRSKAFHDVCWKNIGDAGFPDRIAWMRTAAQKYPYMDLTRVGVYGGSAGGQNAMRALIDHGDFYKAAVADCGCHDNRMDKIWWNEAWMGWPVDKAANDRSSNVVQAHRMQGDLLLMVGELDHNVDPASTMQVVDKLIEANKDFELIVFPGADHGAGGSPYGVRRRNDFFVRHLWNAEPRREATASN